MSISPVYTIVKVEFVASLYKSKGR